MLTVNKLKEKLERINYDITLLNPEEEQLFHRVGSFRKHEGKLAKHFKGKLYLILGTVEHAETGEELVIYKAMYGDYEKYARPIDIFLSKVDKEKYPEIDQEFKFEFIEFK